MYVKLSGVCNCYDMLNFVLLGKGDIGVFCMIGIFLLLICKIYCFLFGVLWIFGFDLW